MSTPTAPHRLRHEREDRIMGTKVRTTINPDVELEVGDAELTDLRRQGLLTEVDGKSADDYFAEQHADEQPPVDKSAEQKAEVAPQGVDVADGTVQKTKGR